MKLILHDSVRLIRPTPSFTDRVEDLLARVEMLEFDVLPEPRTGRLVLAHDGGDFLDRERLVGLDQALAHCSAVLPTMALNIDLKRPGYESAVVEAVRRHGLIRSVLVSSMYRASLAAVRRAEPTVRVGWSVPRASRDYTRSRLLAGPAVTALMVMRRALPAVAARAIRSGQCDALMTYRRLVSPRLVRAISRAGGELYVWPVDDATSLQALDRLGVTGAIIDNPELLLPRPA
jgi:glycerophosphoryl diester phosphodiesterase